MRPVSHAAETQWRFPVWEEMRGRSAHGPTTRAGANTRAGVTAGQPWLSWPMRKVIHLRVVLRKLEQLFEGNRIMASAASFPIAESQVDLRQSQYQKNREEWGPILEKLNHALAESSGEGDSKSIARHLSRGQLLGMSEEISKQNGPNSLQARDRISLLLDQDSPFLELGTFAGYGLEDSNACANLIAGIGSVRYLHSAAIYYNMTDSLPADAYASYSRTYRRKAEGHGMNIQVPTYSMW